MCVWVMQPLLTIPFAGLFRNTLQSPPKRITPIICFYSNSTFLILPLLCQSTHCSKYPFDDGTKNETTNPYNNGDRGQNKNMA